MPQNNLEDYFASLMLFNAVASLFMLVLMCLIWYLITKWAVKAAIKEAAEELRGIGRDRGEPYL